MENVGECLISLGRRDSGVYELLEELATVAFDTEEIFNGVRVEFREWNIGAIPWLCGEPGSVI